MSDPADELSDQAAESTPPRRPAKDPLRQSRTSSTWVALVSIGVLLVLLVVFIAQNTQSVRVTFLGWQGTAPLAVALMVAAAAAILLTALAGTLRILQLRRRVRRATRRR